MLYMTFEGVFCISNGAGAAPAAAAGGGGGQAGATARAAAGRRRARSSLSPSFPHARTPRHLPLSPRPRSPPDAAREAPLVTGAGASGDRASERARRVRAQAREAEAERASESAHVCV